MLFYWNNLQPRFVPLSIRWAYRRLSRNRRIPTEAVFERLLRHSRDSDCENE